MKLTGRTITTRVMIIDNFERLGYQLTHTAFEL